MARRSQDATAARPVPTPARPRPSLGRVRLVRRRFSAPDLQARIQQRAYELWERDGRPDGREQIHWQQAESEIGAGPATG